MADTDHPIPAAAPSRVPSPKETAAAMSASLEDRSKYIRTMAKDMASLAGTPAPRQAAPSPEPETKTEEKVAGVTLPTEETPFFEKPKAREEDRPQERLDLPSMQEARSIVTQAPETLPPDQEREAILSRLRKKVGESAQMSIQQTPIPAAATPPIYPEIPESEDAKPEPEPTQAFAPIATQAAASEWSNIPAPAPSFASLAEPAIPRMPEVRKETYREPIEAVPPPRPSNPQASDRLHTYTSDFADTIDSRGASTFSVLAAEQDARATAPQALSPRRTGNPRALIAVLTGILLLAIAGGGIFATYRFVMTMRDTPMASLTIPTIVFADEYREIEGTGMNLLSALSETANAALLPGNVLVTYVMGPAGGEEGSLLSAPLGGASYIRALGIPAPDILVRNIAEESTIGIIHAANETRPFFALRVDSYERTYAGMLTWEPLMLRDLGILYPLYAPAEAPAIVLTETTATSTETASSTASTSTQVAPPEPVALQPATALTRFTDAIVANHDVRVLRDTNGRSLLLYGYADKRTLLIARDEAAFEALLTRLKSD